MEREPLSDQEADRAMTKAEMARVIQVPSIVTVIGSLVLSQIIGVEDFGSIRIPDVGEFDLETLLLVLGSAGYASTTFYRMYKWAQVDASWKFDRFGWIFLLTGSRSLAYKFG